ncbi:uncharacterized protein [Narcine bancroftii]|uniref:uncharacterized protein n=1 Tax=Narcine bancroftii TaxID=1343680 RepID=UPI0038316D72
MHHQSVPTQVTKDQQQSGQQSAIFDMKKIITWSLHQWVSEAKKKASFLQEGSSLCEPLNLILFPTQLVVRVSAGHTWRLNHVGVEDRTNDHLRSNRRSFLSSAQYLQPTTIKKKVQEDPNPDCQTGKWHNLAGGVVLWKEFKILTLIMKSKHRCHLPVRSAGSCNWVDGCQCPAPMEDIHLQLREYVLLGQITIQPNASINL